MSKRSLILTALVAMLLLGGATAALAEEPSNMQQVRGQVTAVSMAKGTISVRTPSAGPITIQTNNQTQFVIPGIPNPGLGDIRLGDQLVATGQWRTRSQFLARIVAVNRPVPRPIEIAGEVTAVTTSSISVKTRSGEIKTVAVTNTTRFVIPGVSDPELDDVQVGDRAVVTGWVSSTEPDVIVARIVAITRPQPRPVEVAGVVRTIDVAQDLFTLETRPGEIKTVVVADTTRFVIPGVSDPGLDDVRSGDRAVVTGWVRPAEPDRILARTVAIHRPQPRPIKVTGVVRTIDLENHIFTLVTSAGEKTIATTSETQFVIPGVPHAGLDDVRVGDRAVVTGLPDSTNPNLIYARIVAIRRPQPRPGKVSGVVTAVEVDDPDHPTAGTLTVQTAPDVVKTVKTDDQTRFCIPGEENPTIADIEVGDRVVALGFWNEDGSLQAKVVALPDCNVQDISLAEDDTSLIEDDTSLTE